jgi:hypothetical protein
VQYFEQNKFNKRFAIFANCVKTPSKTKIFRAKKMWRISQLATLQKKLHEKHYQNKNNGHGKTTAINQKQ